MEIQRFVKFGMEDSLPFGKGLDLVGKPFRKNSTSLFI
jgi:hypothetical protein